jgi:hypothetical protein
MAGTTEDEDADLRMMLWAVIGAKEELYPKYRDQFLRGDRLVLPYLARTANSGSFWQERVMAGILLERLTKGRQIEMLLQAWGSVPVPRGYSAQHVELGLALAKHAAQTPMFLVEKIWKDNELRRRGIPGDDAAWAALALGQLGEQRALFPLIEFLKGECFNEDRSIRPALAAEALGELGNWRAIPTLCIALVLYEGDEQAGNAAFVAIKQCGRKQSGPLIRAYAERLDPGSAKSLLERLSRIVEGSEAP